MGTKVWQYVSICIGRDARGRDFEIRGGKTYFYRSFDPIEEFTRNWTPTTKSQSICKMEGNDKTTYNISLGYLQQEGVMKFNSDQYDRYTAKRHYNKH